MPSNSRPLTIILNANQSKRTTYLLPLSPSQSQHALILTEARNKFRLKSLSQIFLKGGTLFQPDEVLHSDVRELWVSKGEPYVGKEAPGPGPKRIGPEEEARVDVIAEESYVDPESMKQLKVVAGLEGVVAAIGMPDLHPGNRFPIGCAIAAHGVYPALIGTDVGCGIALYRLASTPSRFAPSKLAARLRGLDDPWDGDVAAWLADRGVHKESEFDKTSLGTVGAGNHFAEVCVVEEVKDAEACERIGVRTGVVYLLVHTGSRGLGKSILQAHSKTNSNPYYPGGTPELDAYLAEHDYAVRWAVANRDLVAYRIASCLGLSWDSSDDTETSDSEQPRGPKPVMPEKLVDVTHNSVTRHALALGNKEAQDVWIHRKGAAPADMGVAPCPGSRGDFSWLLQPVGDGNDNAHSLAHGAGRLHPRGAATLHKNVPGSTTSLGSEVVCTDTALMMEERPEAYKGVQAVVDDLEKRGCAKGIAKLRPVVTYKVRNETTRK